MTFFSAHSSESKGRFARRKTPSAIDYRRLIVDHRRLQNDMSRIMGISSAIIYMIDPKGIFTFLNRAVFEILHYEPSELIGRHFSVIMPKGEYQRVSREFVLPRYAGITTGPEKAPKLFDERRTGARMTRHLEVRLLTKEQSEIKVFSGDVTGIVSAEGAYDLEYLEAGQSKEKAFLGSQGIIYDITRYKELEKEKADLERHLHEIQRVENIGKFAHKVARDLSDRLSAIVDYADVVQRRYKSNDTELRYYTHAICSCARGAAELTDQLLAFARDGCYSLGEVDLNRVVANVSRLVRHTLDSRTHIRCNCHAQVPFVRGDKTALQNALLILAVKIGELATRSGDAIFATREFAADDEFVKRHGLRDNANKRFVVFTMIHTGVPAESQAEIKRPFQQTVKIENDAEDRSGFCYISRCIKRHEGLIEVIEDPNGGIRFDVFLPAIDGGQC